MTGPQVEVEVEPQGESGDGLARVAAEIVRAVDAALEEGRAEDADRLVADLRAGEIADLLEELSSDDRVQLLTQLRDHLDPEVLTHLDEGVREQIFEFLGSSEVAAAITELETDDAVDVIEDLDEDERQEVLDQLSVADRAILEEALSYPEDSAGRMMQREIVTVPPEWTVGDAIDYMRGRAAQLPRDFYDVFVVDADRHPIGVIPLSRLAKNRRPAKIADIMHPDFVPIQLETDQEDVALKFHQNGLISAPVVDAAGRLVGVITADDVVQVIQDEAEEDLMRLGGVTGDDLYGDVLTTTRARFSWLFVNLGTAIVASIVIGFFDAAIDQVVALAILMPIVASMGGNAGTQAMTVAVRALAMKELTVTNAGRVLGKEVVVAFINGLLFAILTGLVAWLWFDNDGLAAVIATAMVLNILIAGLVGVLIPLGLDRMGIDPAVASTVVLTTVTDVVGFLSFLGLAAWVLL